MIITAEMVKKFGEEKKAFDLSRRGKVNEKQMLEVEKAIAHIEKTGAYDFTEYEVGKVTMAIISTIASK